LSASAIDSSTEGAQPTGRRCRAQTAAKHACRPRSCDAAKTCRAPASAEAGLLIRGRVSARDPPSTPLQIVNFPLERGQRALNPMPVAVMIETAQLLIFLEFDLPAQILRRGYRVVPGMLRMAKTKIKH
jgi:hypothetical protein